MKDDKIQIINFKDKSSNWWVNQKHYALLENSKLLLVAGGEEIKIETEFLQAFIKRNKKVFKEREKGIIEKEPPQYLAVITFGEFKGKSVSEVFEINKGYLKWMRDKYNFGAQKELEKQIKEILK